MMEFVATIGIGLGVFLTLLRVLQILLKTAGDARATRDATKRIEKQNETQFERLNDHEKRISHLEGRTQREAA